MRKLLLCLVMASSAWFPLMAHEGHDHEPAVEAAPGGGNLRNAGDFKGELVINGEQLRLYIYDKQLKPVKLDKPELKGDVQFPKEKRRPIVFKRNGDFYEATLKGISKVHRYDLHVELEVGGKKAEIDFGIDNI